MNLRLRALAALRRADVVRPLPPARLWSAVCAGRELQATHAAMVAIAAACDPAGIAVIDERRELSWSELDRRARALAHAFVDRYGAGPRRPVAVMCRNHAAIVETLAAAARAGADVLAVNTELAAPQIAGALSGREVAVVVHDEEFTERLESSGDPSPRLVAWLEDPDAVAPFEALARSCADLAGAPPRRGRITILTSGTTGTPKDVTRDLPARAMLGAITTLVEELGLRRGAPVLVAPPLFHGFGLGVASIAHAVGAPVVLQRRFDPERALALIERHRVACLVAVPVMLQRILVALEGVVPEHTLRSVLAAGAPLSPVLSERFMDAFGEILYNAYGSTETGFGAIAGPADLRRAPGTIGRAPLGASIQVLDEDRRPARVGATGHVFVGGELMSDGYGDGEAKELAGQLMNTGDIGHLDAAGCVFIDGREDDMIVSGAENVFPQEVEDAIAAHPGVADVAVVGVSDPDFGQRLVAFVVANAAEPPTSDDLVAHLRTRLERYKLPREITFRQEIPRTPTGKVLRRSLL